MATAKPALLPDGTATVGPLLVGRTVPLGELGGSLYQSAVEPLRMNSNVTVLELATTMVATFRGNRDIAIGNLIGSSTYNVTFILGTSLLFARGPVTVDPELITVDLPVMVAAALVCLPIFLTGRRVTRVEGVLMVLAYAAYLAYLIIVRT